MIIKEFRIVMPMTVEEYQRGQVYTVAESAKRETGGGDGIEDLINEPFENVKFSDGMTLPSGQYSVKKYHIDHMVNMGSKVPGFVRLLTPRGALDLVEESWNAFPYCRTTLKNEYLAERLTVTIESIHLPDRGETENALNLPSDRLKIREIVRINIGEDPPDEEDRDPEENPGTFKSSTTERGPLQQNWCKECTPVMTCYKVVTCEFKLFGLQTRLESFIQKNEQRIFTTFHRRLFCWIDHWHPMTLEEIRIYERSLCKEIDQQRQLAGLKGYTAVE